MRIWLLVLSFCSFNLDGFESIDHLSVITGQTNSKEKVNICEGNIARLDYIHNQMKKEDKIIVISYLGKKDSLGSLHHRRLHNIKTYFITFLGNESILTAIGEERKKQGSLEIYLKGNLVDTLYAGKNEDIRVGSCDGTDKRNSKLYGYR